MPRARRSRRSPRRRLPQSRSSSGNAGGARGGRREQTTLHDRHVDAGEFAGGDRRRPHHYTTPEEEVDAVRNRVGAIDVSTGTFRITGSGAVELLEPVPGLLRDLAVGRIRYSAMLNDEGATLDDEQRPPRGGRVLRHRDDRQHRALERCITWWNADWQLDAMHPERDRRVRRQNLAGPRARAVMQDLTAADVSGDVMPYLSATRIDVAGVPSHVLRISFVGEMGYEIHFPSAFGEHLWDATLEAGRPVPGSAVRP